MHRFFYRAFMGFVRFLCKFGVRQKYVGLENVDHDGPYIICGNHITWFDGVIILLLHKKRVVHLMCKNELFRTIFGRWLFTFTYFIPVDRGNPNDIQSTKKAIQVLKDGHVLGIFPEGTRSKQQVQLPFHEGAVTLAHRQKVPIVPYGRSERVGPWGKIYVSVGEPYYIETDSRRLSPEESARFTKDLERRVALETEKAKQMKKNHG